MTNPTEHPRPAGWKKFNAPMRPSPSLAAVIGEELVSRPEATKRIWSYIRRRKLQNPKNRRMIRLDAALAAVAEAPEDTEISMFEVAKVLNRNLEPA